MQAAALCALIAGGSAAQEAYLESGRHVVDVMHQFGIPTLSQVCIREIARSGGPVMAGHTDKGETAARWF